jgi:Fur family peroxide stress response transcriptional regulator
MPTLSLGTVYRNLKFLQEQGKVRSLTSTDGIEHFDPLCCNHAHLICKECGKIIDIENVDYESLVKSLNIESDFVLDKVDLSIIGICKKCKENL